MTQEAIRKEIKAIFASKQANSIGISELTGKFIELLLQDNLNLEITRKDSSKIGHLDITVDLLTIIPCFMNGISKVFTNEIATKTTFEKQEAAIGEYLALLYVLNKILTEYFEKHFTVTKLVKQ